MSTIAATAASITTYVSAATAVSTAKTAAVAISSLRHHEQSFTLHYCGIYRSRRTKFVPQSCFFRKLFHAISNAQIYQIV